MADLGRAARPSAAAVSGVAIVVGSCLFTDLSGGSQLVMATVGFDPAVAFLWDSTARKRDGFGDETGSFQWFYITLWDSNRQKHNEKRLGRELFVKRVLEITIKNPLFFKG